MFAFQETNTIDLVITLANKIAELSDGAANTLVDDVTKLSTQEGKLGEVLNKLITHVEVLFKAPVGGEMDIDGSFNLIFLLLNQHFNADSVAHTEYSKKLIAAIASKPSDQPIVRLRLASAMYNTLPSTSPVSFDIYLSVIKLAGATGCIDTVKRELAGLSERLIRWRASSYQVRTMYKAMSEVFRESGNRDESFTYLMEYLKAFEENAGDDAVIKSIKDIAISAIVLGLGSPSVFVLDDLRVLAAISALKGEKIYELLTIFVEGDLNSYIKFHAENTELIEAQGLKHEQLLEKIRYLTLASLCENRSCVSYSEIQSSLNVNETDLVTLLIDSIRLKVVEGRMDQLEKNFIVLRSTQRTFEMVQWEALSTTLEKWQENIAGVLAVLQNAHQVAATGNMA